MTDVTMIAPNANPGTIVQTVNGGNKTVDANGFVSIDARDVTAMLSAGMSMASPSIASSQAISETTNMATQALSIVDAVSDTGAHLTASTASGVFAIASTPGTSLGLVTEKAKGSTVTDKANWITRLPENYLEGGDLTLTINANTTKGSGTISTQTVDAAVYAIGKDGKASDDLVTTKAQTTSATATDYAFTVTGEDLAPGDVLAIQVTQVVTETGGANDSTGSINGVFIG